MAQCLTSGVIASRRLQRRVRLLQRVRDPCPFPPNQKRPKFMRDHFGSGCFLVGQISIHNAHDQVLMDFLFLMQQLQIKDAYILNFFLRTTLVACQNGVMMETP